MWLIETELAELANQNDFRIEDRAVLLAGFSNPTIGLRCSMDRVKLGGCEAVLYRTSRECGNAGDDAGKASDRRNSGI